MPLGADIQSLNEQGRQVSYVNAFTYHSYLRLLCTLIIVEVKICACQVSSLIGTSGEFFAQKRNFQTSTLQGSFGFAVNFPLKLNCFYQSSRQSKIASVVTAVDLSLSQLFIKVVSWPYRKISYSDSTGSQTFSHVVNQLFSYCYSLSVNWFSTFKYVINHSIGLYVNQTMQQ